MEILPITTKYSYNTSPQPKIVFGSGDCDTFLKNTEGSFPLKAITSKTAQKLFNMDYTPISEPREGYFLTFVLGNNSDNPVDIYVKQIYSSFMNPQKPSLMEEKYCFYRENPNGELTPVGTRWITFDVKNKKITPGFMESKDKTLSGIGLREQQLTYEIMKKEGYSNIDLLSVQDAYNFHSKCGFISTDYLIYRSEHGLAEFVNYWAGHLRINENSVREMMVFKTENDFPFLNINKTLENFVLYLNKAGIKIAKDIGIDMKLSEAAKLDWDKIVLKQPILLNKLKVV